jgi:hypothetical protein
MGEVFRPKREERAARSDGWDIKRFEAIADDEIREATWLARRRHDPQGRRLPAEVDMDSWYLRLSDEEDYTRRLSALTASAPKIPDEEVSLALWCGESQAVLWPCPAAPGWGRDPIQEFPQGGDLWVAGEPYARDSAYALFMTCYHAGHHDPGRFAAECNREFHDQSCGDLVSWHQVEYYRVCHEERRALYPGIPSWWFAVEVPANMSVPFPAVLAYRGSALVRHDALHWAVFKTEWAVATLGRLVPDLLLRGVMWRIPLRLRMWWDVLGIGALLRGSEYALGDVQAGLYFHDQHSWIGGEEMGPKRGRYTGSGESWWSVGESSTRSSRGGREIGKWRKPRISKECNAHHVT